MRYSENNILIAENSFNLYFEILMQATDGVIIIDEKNSIIFFNKAAERLWGYSASDVTGRNVSCLVPMEHRSRHDDYIERNRTTGIDHIVGTSREITFTHSSGDYAVAEMSVSAITIEPSLKRYYMAIVKGVTEESHRQKLLVLQNKVFTELAGKTTEQDIADMLCAEAEKMVPHSVAALLQITSERGVDILSGEGLPRRKSRELSRLVLSDADIRALYAHPEEARQLVWHHADGQDEQGNGLLDCWASAICNGTGEPIGIFALYSRNREKITNWPQKIVSGCVPSCAAIIERGKTRQKLNRLDRHDSLTGLLNRNAVTEVLKNMMAHAVGLPFALLVLDIDLFQDINNLLGYDQGDVLLNMVAQRLVSQCRSNYVIGRLGGDDFVIIIPGADKTMASEFTKNLVKYMKEPVYIDDHEIVVSLSVGISLYPDDSAEVEQVLNCAEVAMLEAKKTARGSFRVLDGRAADDVRSRLVVGSALRKAVQRAELRLFYQPQICVSTGRVHGVEALARWQHPVLGAVPPSRFIPIAEETGQIEAIGRWSIMEACRQLAAWDAAGIVVPVVSVNISAGHFSSPDLPQQISEILALHKLAPDRLTIEMTESVMMQQNKQVSAILAAILDIGVGLSLDDFGTGFSSLSRLSSLPLTEIKIDRSFIANFENSLSSLIVMEAAITIGKRLGIGIVTEGVETPSQEVRLRNMGCDIMQGYLFAHPMPPDALLGWMQAHNQNKQEKITESGNL